MERFGKFLLFLIGTCFLALLAVYVYDEAEKESPGWEIFAAQLLLVTICWAALWVLSLPRLHHIFKRLTGRKLVKVWGQTMLGGAMGILTYSDGSEIPIDGYPPKWAKRAVRKAPIESAGKPQ